MTPDELASETTKLGGVRLDESLRRRLRNAFPALGIAAVAAIVAAVMWWAFHQKPDKIGYPAEWFAGLGAFAAIAVALWQSIIIRKQAAEELRSAHNLARVDRIHLLEQRQKQALIEVSRAVAKHTYLMDTLWGQAAQLGRSTVTEHEREWWFGPITEKLGEAAENTAMECANAQMLMEHEQLIAAVEQIRDAADKGMQAAKCVREQVISGRPPDPNAIPYAISFMRETVKVARVWATDLLRTGYEN